MTRDLPADEGDSRAARVRRQRRQRAEAEAKAQREAEARGLSNAKKQRDQRRQNMVDWRCDHFAKVRDGKIRRMRESVEVMDQLQKKVFRVPSPALMERIWAESTLGSAQPPTPTSSMWFEGSQSQGHPPPTYSSLPSIHPQLGSSQEFEGEGGLPPVRNPAGLGGRRSPHGGHPPRQQHPLSPSKLGTYRGSLEVEEGERMGGSAGSVGSRGQSFDGKRRSQTLSVRLVTPSPSTEELSGERSMQIHTPGADEMEVLFSPKEEEAGYR